MNLSFRAISVRLIWALSVVSAAPLLLGQSAFQTGLNGMHPMAYWPLGSNFNDISGNVHTATAVGAVPFMSPGPTLGTPGSGCCNSANFDQGGYVSVPGQAFNFSAAHPFSVLAWIRTVQQQGGAQVIVGNLDDSKSLGWLLGVDNGQINGSTGSGRLMLVLEASKGVVAAVESTLSVNDGNWHLIAATYDGSGMAAGILLYIDGSLAAVTVASDNLGGASITASTPLAIGATSNGNNTFEGGITQVAIFGSAVTPVQITKLGEDATQSHVILPQFAFGDGWYSAIYFKYTPPTGVTSSPVSFTVNFTNDSGNPLTVPSINDSSTTLTIPSGGTAVIEAPNSGHLSQGYVTAALPLGVSAYEIFRQSVPGFPDQEAAVSPIFQYTGFSSLTFDDTNGLVTAVAIANPTSQVATIAIVASDTNGNQIGTSSMMLQPFNKTEARLRDIAGLGPVAGMRGSVTFTISTGAVAVLGLRFDGTALSSAPASPGYQLHRLPGLN